MPATLAAIYRFPVKGLRAESLDTVDVRRGGGIPDDRRFAFARDGASGDAGAFTWKPKQKFAMLMRDAELARLGCRVDLDGQTIELAWPGEPPCVASFATDDGRGALTAYANRVLGPAVQTPLRFVEAGPLSLTDVPENCVSLLNLASVRDLGSRIGTALDPLRFRANLAIDGLAPWAEFDWVGSKVRIGNVRLRIHTRIRRCAATGVNPLTATRDVNVLKALKTEFGHIDMGLYAEVLDVGRLSVGDPIDARATRTRSNMGHTWRFLRFLARSARVALRGR